MSTDTSIETGSDDASAPGLKPRMTPPVFTRAFASDAMYFHAARQSLEQARAAKIAVDDFHRHWRALEQREQVAEAKGDDYESERVAIVMVEHEDGRMGEVYGPYLQALAIVHVMAASALEAHVNERGMEQLTGKEWEYFDKLPLEGKWLFLPRLLQRPDGFDPGAHPFQGFARLVKVRNLLMHQKPQQEEWKLGEPPTFLAKLALTLPDAEASLESAAGMVRKLAALLGRPTPYWIDKAGYFVFNR